MLSFLICSGWVDLRYSPKPVPVIPLWIIVSRVRSPSFLHPVPNLSSRYLPHSCFSLLSTSQARSELFSFIEHSEDADSMTVEDMDLELQQLTRPFCLPNPNFSNYTTATPGRTVLVADSDEENWDLSSMWNNSGPYHKCEELFLSIFVHRLWFDEKSLTLGFLAHRV